MVTKIFCTLASLSILCLTSANNIVDLGYAKYRGNLTFPDTVAYLGLPYAEPPLSDLRWRAPLPLNTTRVASQVHSQVVDASVYPDFCVQGTTGSALPQFHLYLKGSYFVQMVMLAVQVQKIA